MHDGIFANESKSLQFIAIMQNSKLNSKMGPNEVHRWGQQVPYLSGTVWRRRRNNWSLQTTQHSKRLTTSRKTVRFWAKVANLAARISPKCRSRQSENEPQFGTSLASSHFAGKVTENARITVHWIERMLGKLLQVNSEKKQKTKEISRRQILHLSSALHFLFIDIEFSENGQCCQTQVGQLIRDHRGSNRANCWRLLDSRYR